MQRGKCILNLISCFFNSLKTYGKHTLEKRLPKYLPTLLH